MIMKIEKINEKSISCTLSSFDLSVRNMSIRELAYGSEKARKLFDEMMTKASDEVGFKVENTPIMIEAIPLGRDSIKLIITKVMDPEELDARFSRFTKDPEDRGLANESWLGKLASLLLEGAEDFKNQAGVTDESVKKQIESVLTPGDKHAGSHGASAKKQKTSDSRRSDGSLDGVQYRVFAFDDLDMVINAAKVSSLFSGESTLYRKPDSATYILTLKTMDKSDDSFARTCNSIAEYSSLIKAAPHTDAYFEEHYIPVIRQDAIRKLAGI